MNELNRCPKCGSPLPNDAPAGLCPKCLVQAGFESEGQAEKRFAPTTPSPASSAYNPPSVDDLAKQFPQLEVLELVGKGGMGIVYKARQPQLDRLVAVKVLLPEISNDPAFAERFNREARALAKLSHPRIVGVHDFGRTTDGFFYFIMEFVDGLNLRQAMQSGHIAPQEALAIVPQICEALQFAHEEGIVHRDIKPENILIDKRGRVKIADFGLAKLLGEDAVDHRLTATQQVMGTLRYMAPEQMQGSREVDHRADIYSLGVVFYELLTGELPMGRFAPPSKKVQIDVRLDEIVLRSLEQEPEQRYQHASEIKSAMESVASSPASAAPAESGGRLVGRVLLLDETDRAARLYQHFFLLGGMAWILLGVILALLVPLMSAFLPISLVVGIGGIAMMVAASRNRQQWEIEYLGHSLRFENSVYTSGCLIIDGKKMAAGGVGLSTELSARIPRGLGAGDRIVVTTNAGFLSFRCRIYVERKSSSPTRGREPVVAEKPSKVEGSLVDWVLRQSRTIQVAIEALLVLLIMLGGIGFVSVTTGSEHLPSGGLHTWYTIGTWDPWYENEWRDGKGGHFHFNVFTGSFFMGIVSFVSLVMLLKITWREIRRRQASSNGPNRSSPLPQISLWTSIAGLVMPVVLAVIGSLLAHTLHLPDTYFILCGAVAIVLELVAFACGVLAWRSTSGKAGLIISVVSLVLFVLAILSLIVRFDSEGTIRTVTVPACTVLCLAAKPRISQSLARVEYARVVRRRAGRELE